MESAASKPNKTDMNKPTVEFATTVYEKDWEIILKSKRLEDMIKGLNYEFDKRTLIINNVKNFEKVEQYAKKHVESGLLTSYVDVRDYKDKIKEFFKIDNDEGFYYLHQYLTMIYRCDCDYLLSLTGDSFMINNEEWIDTAIQKIVSDNKVIVASPSWHGNIEIQMRESFKDDEDFYYSYVFSDQCFLLKPSFFRADIYNEVNELSYFYPERGRHVKFEERIFKYLRNNDFHLIKHKRALYRHKNLPKGQFKTWLCLNLGINRKKYGIRI